MISKIRSFLANLVTAGLWGRLGRILFQHNENLLKISEILSKHEDSIKDLLIETNKLLFRLNETQRYIEQQLHVVLPAHICGPTLTTLGEFGLGDANSPMTPEEQEAIQKALEAEKGDSLRRQEQESILRDEAEPENPDAGAQAQA